MHAVRLLAVALIVTGVFASTAAAQPAAAASGGVDVSHLPAEAATGVIIRVRETLQSPDNSLWPIEVISAMGTKEMGIDPIDIDQVLVFWEKTAKLGPEGIGVVLRLVKPYKVDGIFPQYAKRSVKASIGDQPIRRLGDGEPCYAMVNDRTILMAFEPLLKRMLTAKGDGAVGKLLKDTSPRATAAFAVSLDAVRDEIDAAMKGAPKLPPPFADLLEVPNLTSAVVTSVRLDKKFSAQIALHGRDAAAGEKLEATVKTVLKVGREIFVQQVTASMDRNDPVAVAGTQYLERMSKVIVDGIAITRTGKTVTLSVQTDTNMAQVGMLAGLTLPAVQSAREAARRNMDANIVRQVMMVMKIYETEHATYPARANFSADGKPLLSWRVHMLPYMEEAALYKKFRLDEPWDSAHNIKLVDQMPGIYRSATDASGETKTRFVAVTGKGTLFGGEKGTKESAVKDGMSRTAAVVQLAPGAGVIWTKPDDLDVDSETFMDMLDVDSSRGFPVGFLDGSVRQYGKPLDKTLLKAIFSIAGGEEVDIFRR